VPFDPELAARVRQALASRADLAEKRMFGGVSFLLSGNVACCVIPAGLLVRHEPAEAAELLRREGTHSFVMAGKPQHGWLVVDPAALANARDLNRWVKVGTTYATGLPARHARE
jgi:TfoX N-terminal domain